MTDALVLRNALLIDGTGAPPKPDATVVVAEGIIQDIGGLKTKSPKGARVVDLKGK